MTQRRSEREDGGAPAHAPRSAGARVGWSLFALVLLGSQVLLCVFLVRECGAGGDVVRAYAATIRGGAEVSAEVGGLEAAELTAHLRRTTDVSVLNFQGQEGTACYWVTLQEEGASTSASFLLEESADGAMRVVGATLRSECDCPEDEDLRCHIVR